MVRTCLVLMSILMLYIVRQEENYMLYQLSKTLRTEFKLSIFYSFIVAQFEYCTVVWHFCSRENFKNLECIQKYALHYVYNNYSSSYEELLNKANRSTLYVQWLRSILSIVYKSLMKQGPIYVQDLFVINEHSRNKRYFPLVQPI